MTSDRQSLTGSLSPAPRHGAAFRLPATGKPTKRRSPGNSSQVHSQLAHEYGNTWRLSLR